MGVGGRVLGGWMRLEDLGCSGGAVFGELGVRGWDGDLGVQGGVGLNVPCSSFWCFQLSCI